MADVVIGGSLIANEVVDLETALRTGVNCIVQQFNPGFNLFLERSERYSPNFVLLGGHRASGKTTIVDTLIDKVNRNFVKVRTHVTREERKTEKAFIPADHMYLEKDAFIRNYNNAAYFMVYSYNGNFYGIPNDALFNLRGNENTFPVIGVVNPHAFKYLLNEELFPNAMNVMITTTSQNNVDLKERVAKRYQRERITDPVFINQAIDSVISDKDIFASLNSSVDIILINNNPEIDTLRRSTAEIHASRIEEYMKWHKSRYSSSQRGNEQTAKSLLTVKPDKMRIFINYINIFINKLFGFDYSLPLPGSSVNVNLKVIRSQVIDYVFKKEIKHKYIQRAIYKHGVLHRHNGLLQLLFPHTGHISKFELDNLSPLNRIRFGTITSFLGNSYVIDEDGMGVYYALSDIKPESSESASKSPYMLYIGFRNPRDIQKLLEQ
ncbi:hypothetical protein HZA96_03630 [Candidatus Woesearchaeota archaeon]|nr:hypothetical protein [Candidatus Woesearchaeota archaeon]